MPGEPALVTSGRPQPDQSPAPRWSLQRPRVGRPEPWPPLHRYIAFRMRVVLRPEATSRPPTTSWSPPSGPPAAAFDDYANSCPRRSYCALRHDATVGVGVPPPRPEDLGTETLRWSVRWLIAGLPQMSPSALADVLTAPVALELTAPGGRVDAPPRAGGRGARVETAGGVGTGTVASCSADGFVR
jgi:hypothetical protein